MLAILTCSAFADEENPEVKIPSGTPDTSSPADDDAADDSEEIPDNDTDIKEDESGQCEKIFNNAVEMIEALDDNSSSIDVAGLLIRLDEIETGQCDTESIDIIKYDITLFLKVMIREELKKLYLLALKSGKWKKSEEIMIEASKRIAIFPYADDENTKKEINGIISEFKETSLNLMRIQHLKYISRALGIMEEFHKSFNSISSFLSPLEENRKLMTSAAIHLGRIDTKYLPEAVMETFTALIDLTKDQISEKQGDELDIMIKNTVKLKMEDM
jgi:hypothetical protein